ncbi:MAG: hypothetical protein ABIG64_09090 [Candidatus Omnitrophota bacterium]
MKFFPLILMFFLISSILSGCVSKFTSRYDSITKQNEYVSMKFNMSEQKFIDKNKHEIIEILGNPERKVQKEENGTLKETWVYYPKETNNFIAMFIMFEKEKVVSATYESVM